MRIAAAAYPIDWLNRWNDYVGKLRVWVRTAAEQGAQLLVFPENGALELASLAGEDNARDIQRTIEAISARIKDVDDLHGSLAREFKVHICAASGPMRNSRGKPVNRSRLFAPDGTMACQDKLTLSKIESTDWGLEAGTSLRVFETSLGRLGVAHGDAATTPHLVRTLTAAGAEIILMPGAATNPESSATLRAAAAAAALANNTVVVLSVPLGHAPWLLDNLRFSGTAAIFCAPEDSASKDGVLGQGKADSAGWTYADVDVTRHPVHALAMAGAPDSPLAPDDVEILPLGAQS